MPIASDNKQLHFIPWDKVNTPAQGLVHSFINHWWVCCPDRGLLLYGKNQAAQANTNEEITRRIAAQLYPWAEVRQIPLVQIRAHRSYFM